MERVDCDVPGVSYSYQRKSYRVSLKGDLQQKRMEKYFKTEEEAITWLQANSFEDKSRPEPLADISDD